jgi:osmotically-inducible protein OsmY
VETIVFRDPAVPKGDLNINAENGTVFLRGQVESSELVEELGKRVRRISGVRQVENLLHLPGMPAPASHRRTGPWKAGEER